MKNAVIAFLVSRAGSLLTPIIAALVGAAVAKLAAFDSNLAGQLDQSAIVGFVVAGILSVINYATNVRQSDGIRRIQAVVNTDVDGVAGPVTYREVRRATQAQ